MNDYLKSGLDVIEAEMSAIQAMADRLGDSFKEAVQELLNCRTKVVVTGLGKSGHIARKITSTFNSTGMPAVFLHASEAGHGDLGIYSPGDPVIVISKSGSTAELVHVVPDLKQSGSKLIGILGRMHGPLADAADILLDASVAREADPLGIVPTSSTVVALAIGDALAGALMKAHSFTEKDFARNHPSGQLGRNLLLTVGDVMHPLEKTAVVRQNTSLKECVTAMTRFALGAALVMNDDAELLGIITDGDLRRAIAEGEDIRAMTASCLMTPNPVCVHPAATLQQAIEIMEDRPSQIAVLPVTDETSGKPLGILRLHDVYQPGEL